jgi:hypothetical protein
MKNGLEIDEWGNKRYYLNDQSHREDGPACEYVNGLKRWYQHDKLHRLDGPAVEWADGDKEWYFNGKYMNCNSQEDFEDKITKLIFT